MIKLTLLNGKHVTDYNDSTIEEVLHDIEANGYNWLEMIHRNNGDIVITIYEKD